MGSISGDDFADGVSCYQFVVFFGVVFASGFGARRGGGKVRYSFALQSFEKLLGLNVAQPLFVQPFMVQLNGLGGRFGL